MTASLFLSLNLGFVAGIATASFGRAAIFLLLGLAGLFYRPQRWLEIVGLIIGVILGGWRFSSFTVPNSNQLLALADHQVAVRGWISEEIDPGGNNQKATIQITALDNHPASGLLLATLPKYPRRSYGDELLLTGRLSRPENFSAFRYDRYLARYGIAVLMSWPKTVYLGRRVDTYSYFLSFKARLTQLIDRALPEPEAGLAAALLLGYKKTLMSPEAEAFSCCGLSHIVAISGSHLSLLASLAIALLTASAWPRRRTYRAVAVFVWGYTFLTGAAASAVRAAIMISLVLWGKGQGRAGTGGRLLIITAAVMLLNNPWLLRDDLGFQLSFLAMIALLYFCPAASAISNQPAWLPALIMTLAAQFLTWPVIAFNFNTVSLIAPLANILAVWLFVWLLPGLLAAAGLGLLFPTGAVWWFAPVYPLLRYLNSLSVWLASWPQACPKLSLNPEFIAIYYLILALLYVMGHSLFQYWHRAS